MHSLDMQVKIPPSREPVSASLAGLDGTQQVLLAVLAFALGFGPIVVRIWRSGAVRTRV